MPSSIDQRRYARVPIHKKLAELSQEFGASVTWPNLEESPIRDLSYKGFAVTRPGLFQPRENEVLELAINLGLVVSFRAQVRVVWTNFEAIGLEVLELPPEGHQAMGLFLEQKLKGRQLKPVERFHFDSKQTFRYWYQGDGIHVFVWMDSGGNIQTIRIERDDRTTSFERGSTLDPNQPGVRAEILLLSELSSGQLPVAEFLATLKMES